MWQQVKPGFIYSRVVFLINKCIDEPLILRRTNNRCVCFSVFISGFNGFVYRHGHYINSVLRHGRFFKYFFFRKKKKSSDEQKTRQSNTRYYSFVSLQPV